MTLLTPSNSILSILDHAEVTGRTQPLLHPRVPVDRAVEPPIHPPQLPPQQSGCKELQSPSPAPHSDSQSDEKQEGARTRGWGAWASLCSVSKDLGSC